MQNTGKWHPRPRPVFQVYPAFGLTVPGQVSHKPALALGHQVPVFCTDHHHLPTWMPRLNMITSSQHKPALKTEKSFGHFRSINTNMTNHHQNLQEYQWITTKLSEVICPRTSNYHVLVWLCSSI